MVVQGASRNASARYAGAASTVSGCVTITVLIPTWRRPNDLARCLAGIAAQARPPDEVLVIVREGDLETKTALRDISPETVRVRVVAAALPGQVAALNAGLEAAHGDIIAITDDDTSPWPDWLARIESHFDADPGVGGVGGRDVLRDSPLHNPANRSVVGKVRWFRGVVGNHHVGIGGPRDVDVLKGANMSYRRDAIEGLRFDERLRGTGAQVHNDLAFSLAVRRRGWRLVYDPQAAVDHFPATRFDEDARDRQSAEALVNAVHNETLVLLEWLPVWRKALTFAYGLAVGSRSSPGVVLGLERWVREPDRGAVRARVKSAFRGRILGLISFLTSAGARRRATRQSSG
jgi:cellulose synthase/poly-beta-1,6-N-acetylglucosamine synthase-like glycosyltransferase